MNTLPNLRAASMPSNEIAPDADWLSVATLAVWLLLAGGGIIGFLVPYRHPGLAAPKIKPTQAEVIHVQLTAEPVAQLQIRQPQITPAVPPPVDDVKPITAPPLIAVAEPLPKIAFALPVTGPVRIVEASRAASHAPRENVPAAATAPTASEVQTLTFGQGEGNQPAPEYPVRARREGQEGTVLVEFTVGANGDVLRAEPARACPWKLLNDAAVRVVKDRWQFRPGHVRAYQVAIRFQLAK